MGQTIAKLNEKFLAREGSSNRQESAGMLHDMTADDSDLNVTDLIDGGGDKLNDTKTPPNIIKLKCDPRSPSNFDRTPLKVPRE